MTYQQEELMKLLDLDVDGMTTPEEGRRLENCGGGPEFVLEKRSLEKVHRVLHSARIQVKNGFKANLMETLPMAAWEARGRWAWAFPAAILTLLVVASGFLVGHSGETPLSGALGGLVAAVGQMVVATATTGAGLLDASWRALGWGVRELVIGSPAVAGAFGLALASLGILLYSLLSQRNRKSLSRVRSRRRR